MLLELSSAPMTSCPGGQCRGGRAEDQDQERKASCQWVGKGAAGLPAFTAWGGVGLVLESRLVSQLCGRKETFVTLRYLPFLD